MSFGQLREPLKGLEGSTWNQQMLTFGIQGLNWLQILPEVAAISKEFSWPIVLVIHLGGTDLCFTWVLELLTIIGFDMDKYRAFFQDLVIVWSEIVPRVVWKGAWNPAAIERAWRLINSWVSRQVCSSEGIFVYHCHLEGNNGKLILVDWVHLNDIGPFFALWLAGWHWKGRIFTGWWGSNFVVGYTNSS